MNALVIETPPFDVYENMALDEFLAENPRGEFILRFYNWKNCGVTFGYGQNYDYVINNLPLNFKKSHITRRPTGGGVVFHDNDLTFSLVFKNKENLKPQEIYLKLHKTICTGLLSRKIFCRLSGEKTDKKNYAPVCGNIANECFANPVKHDILDEKGNKILGGALRVFEYAVLYQGSLRISRGRKRRAELKLAVMKAFAREHSIKWRVNKIRSDFLKQIKYPAQNKYNSRDWIYKL